MFSVLVAFRFGNQRIGGFMICTRADHDPNNMHRRASVVTGTQNFHLLLWITGAYLFCSGSVGLAHDGSVHTNFPVEHRQEKSDHSQTSLQTNVKQTLVRWHDVTEMRDIPYTKWRMEERTHSYTMKKHVPRVERRSKKYTIMIPESRTKIVQYATTKHRPEGGLQDYQVRIPFQEEVEKQYTVMIPVQQERTTSWTVRVPYTETLETMYTVMVPVEEKRTEEYTVRIPFVEKLDETYTVKVPYQEKTVAFRKVTKRIPVKTTKTVTCHSGYWRMEAKTVSENKHCASAENPCVPKTIYCRQWVPTSETREVPTTSWKYITEEIPYTLYVKKYRSEERTRTQYIRRYREEVRTREYSITKMVPEKRTKTVSMKKYHEEERTGTYCVTRMVPEKRTKPVCITRHRWETRTREQTLQTHIPELRTKTVRYTVMVPREKTCTYSVLVHDTMTEEKTERYHVHVPYSVSKKVPVTVRRYIVEQVKNGTTRQSGEIHSGDPNHSKKSA